MKTDRPPGPEEIEQAGQAPVRIGHVANPVGHEDGVERTSDSRRGGIHRIGLQNLDPVLWQASSSGEDHLQRLP